MSAQEKRAVKLKVAIAMAGVCGNHKREGAQQNISRQQLWNTQKQPTPHAKQPTSHAKQLPYTQSNQRHTLPPTWEACAQLCVIGM